MFNKLYASKQDLNQAPRDIDKYFADQRGNIASLEGRMRDIIHDPAKQAERLPIGMSYTSALAEAALADDPDTGRAVLNTVFNQETYWAMAVSALEDTGVSPEELSIAAGRLITPQELDAHIIKTYFPQENVVLDEVLGGPSIGTWFPHNDHVHGQSMVNVTQTTSCSDEELATQGIYAIIVAHHEGPKLDVLSTMHKVSRELFGNAMPLLQATDDRPIPYIAFRFQVETIGGPRHRAFPELNEHRGSIVPVE